MLHNVLSYCKQSQINSVVWPWYGLQPTNPLKTQHPHQRQARTIGDPSLWSCNMLDCSYNVKHQRRELHEICCASSSCGLTCLSKESGLLEEWDFWSLWLLLVGFHGDTVCLSNMGMHCWGSVTFCLRLLLVIHLLFNLIYWQIW